MAELVLSKEEKESASYLEWSDEALGRLVKTLALKISDNRGVGAAAYTSCAVMLACMVAEQNKDSLVMQLGGVEDEGRNVGDWEIIIRRQGRLH